MLRLAYVALFALPGVTVAQDGPQIVRLAPTPAGETVAVETKDIVPDIHACIIPDNQKFTAQIRLTVTPAGLPDQVTLLQSTGNTCLDDAAMAAVKAATFVPAAKRGAAVPQTMIELVSMAHFDKDHTPPVKPAPGTLPPRVTSAPLPDRGSCRPQKDTNYTVLVSLTVGIDGKPQNPSVAKTSGDSCFDAAALKTARQYGFNPATLNGHPVAFSMNIEMQFDQLR